MPKPSELYPKVIYLDWFSFTVFDKHLLVKHLTAIYGRMKEGNLNDD